MNAPHTRMSKPLSAPSLVSFQEVFQSCKMYVSLSLQHNSPSSINRGDSVFSARSGPTEMAEKNQWVVSFFCHPKIVRVLFYILQPSSSFIFGIIVIIMNHWGYVAVSNHSPAVGLLIFLHTEFEVKGFHKCLAAVMSPRDFRKSFSLFKIFYYCFPLLYDCVIIWFTVAQTN